MRLLVLAAALTAGTPEADMEKMMRPVAESWHAVAVNSGNKGKRHSAIEPLTAVWIKRMRTTLNNDVRRNKFARDISFTFWKQVLGMTTCQLRAYMRNGRMQPE